MATTLGLGGRALDLPITMAESDLGLVPPAVATHLLGQGGAFLVLLQVAPPPSPAARERTSREKVTKENNKREQSNDETG